MAAAQKLASEDSPASGWRALPQKLQRLTQHDDRLGARQWLGEDLLTELLALIVDRRWQMQITGRRQAKQLLQINLARGRREQIGTTHHLGNTLLRIIHHHGKLVGMEAVGTARDEIADFAFE